MSTTLSESQAIPWTEFKREFIGLYGPRFRARATKKGIQHALGLLDGLGVQSTSDLTVPLITRLVESRPPEHSDHTLKGILLRVQSAVNYCDAAGYLPGRNPFTVRPIKTWCRPSPPRGKKHLSRAEIKAILELMKRDSQERQGWQQWTARRLYCLTALIAYTGLRRNEALYLQVSDVNLPAQSIDVVDRAEHKCKTPGSAQPVAIPSALVTILDDWLPHRQDAPLGFPRPASPWLFPTIRTGKPWTGGKEFCTPLGRLKAVAARARVATVTWHMLRRSIATHLEAHGAGPAMIQRLLRHTSSATTETWYRKADLSNMLACVDGFQY